MEVPALENWTTQEEILPISLLSFEFDTNLMQAPKMLKDIVYQYKHNKDILDSQKESTVDNILGSNKNSFLNNYIIDIFLFVIALISLIVTMIVMYVVYKHAKLKTLVTSIALQQIREQRQHFTKIGSVMFTVSAKYNGTKL